MSYYTAMFVPVSMIPWLTQKNLLERNPWYVHIQNEGGRESTVLVQNLAPISYATQSVKPMDVREIISIIPALGLLYLENSEITGHKNVTDETDIPWSRGSLSEESDITWELSCPRESSIPVLVTQNPLICYVGGHQKPIP